MVASNGGERILCRLIGCQMTVDVMGLEKEHLIDGIELGGAATFLDFAFDAQVSLNF